MDLRRFFACIIAAVFIILSVPALADEGEIHVDDAFLGGGDEDPSYTEPVIEQEGKVQIGRASCRERV